MLKYFAIVAIPAILLVLTSGAINVATGDLPDTTSKRPNIIVILADDMGYSDIGSFGSEIETPNLDRMANSGLRLTQFYNASRCCPTRASLLTGLYQHQAGVGDMVNTREQPAYQGFLNRNCVTIAEALKHNGYNTFMAGKWHIGTAPDKWPRMRGFERYFGLIDGASSYFNTNPYRPNQKLTIALDDKEYNTGKDFYSTNAYTDHALEFIKTSRSPGKPFFLYLAYTAPHWPLHALPDDISRFRERYRGGWDKLRAERLARMKKMRLCNEASVLSPRHENVPAWDNADEQLKTQWIEKMSVYAAMVYRMDKNIGRILQELEASGEIKNTLIVFLSDNGGSNESIKGTGFTAEKLAANFKPASDPESFTAYEFAGANLSNTPFRMYKRFEYEGGIASPFIAYYPGVIKPGRIDHRPAHIIDIMPTCLSVAGANYPSSYEGNRITPAEGTSLLPLFTGLRWKGHDAIFFEHEGNRAVREGKWKLVSEYPSNKWQLYDMNNDRAELHDLSASLPARVKDMDAQYQAWAKRAGVIPFALLDKKADK